MAFIGETTHDFNAYNEYFFSASTTIFIGATHFIWLKSVLSTFRRALVMTSKKLIPWIICKAFKWFMRCILLTLNKNLYWNSFKNKIYAANTFIMCYIYIASLASSLSSSHISINYTKQLLQMGGNRHHKHISSISTENSKIWILICLFLSHRSIVELRYAKYELHIFSFSFSYEYRMCLHKYLHC